jgi:hypothetical protein
VLRCAGLQTDAFHERAMDVIIKKAPPAFELELPCFLVDPAAMVHVAMLEDPKVARLRVSAADQPIEQKIRTFMERYSAGNDGEALLDREREALWSRIKSILARHGMTYEKVSTGEALLNRQAIEGLIQLAAGLERHLVSNITDVFANGHVVRADQEFAVRWLMKLFVENPDPFDRGQLSLRIWENAVPAVGDELVAMVENRKYGSARAGLLMALATTKHPRAADVIASVLHEQHMAWAGVGALAKLKATQHVDAVRRCLRDPDSAVRREAKKALKKLGFAVETPPPPVHLVKGRAKVPEGLEEWSQNLDMDDLEPVLKKLCSCIESGFGDEELREVMGVVEEMRVEQTKVLRFPITAAGERAEIWLSIFMDDIDSPDLAVYASAAVIQKFEPLVPLK